MNENLRNNISRLFTHLPGDHYCVGALVEFKSMNKQDYIFEVPGSNKEYFQAVSYSSPYLLTALQNVLEDRTDGSWKFNMKHVSYIHISQFRKDEHGRNQCYKTEYVKYSH